MEERMKKMVELIKQRGTVNFAQLKENFPDVSEMTLRRDLEQLDQARQIVRIHGGARSLDAVVRMEDYFYNRSQQNVEKKRQIAQKAIKLLKHEMSIFIDSGSTVTELSRIFPDEQFLIVTSGLSCALELSRLTAATTHLLGGKLNSNSLSVNGSQSIAMIEDLNFNIAFCGVVGYSTKMGFTTALKEDYELKSAAIRKAERVVILMDSSKVGICSPFTFARLSDVDIIVSDDGLAPEAAEEFRKNGITVY